MLRAFLLLFGSLVLIVLGGCHQPRPSSPLPASLRIMTYNIHHGRGQDGEINLKRLSEVIRAHGPDLVALQEVDRMTGRSGGVDQAAELGALTGMQVHYGAAMPYDGGEYGEAVLTTLEVRNVVVQALPHQPDREPRAALWVEVMPAANSSPVWFIATHLDHWDDPGDRRLQAQAIHDRWEEMGQPSAILAGDLNANPDSEVLSEILGSWKDAATKNPQPTYSATNPNLRIDYVLVQPPVEWRIRNVRTVMERIASDHLPVVVDLELNP